MQRLEVSGAVRPIYGSLDVKRLSAGRMDDGRVRAFGPETHPSYLHFSFQPAATREPYGLCGNQCYSRVLLMMGIMVPETC